MGCCWGVAGLLLGCCWGAAEALPGRCWAPLGRRGDPHLVNSPKTASVLIPEASCVDDESAGVNAQELEGGLLSGGGGDRLVAEYGWGARQGPPEDPQRCRPSAPPPPLTRPPPQNHQNLPTAL